ncbi:MAG: fumarylacetoacetate hydrolase family protein [Caldithrix sp.]|nr:fumarylacetoacetate hydrolase family protein [Caldithrix sp.]
MLKTSDGQEMTPTKIIGVGRNYAEHIKEMQSETTSKPVLFIKPPTSITDINQPIKIPQNAGSVHHEVELAVCIGKTVANATLDLADQYIAGYGLALDLTLRDIQKEAKHNGLPWAVAKGFDNACPISDIIPVSKAPDVNNCHIRLSVNGSLRQEGHTSQMIFKIPALIHYISQFFTLLPGDLILTGTPSGVGPLHSGDLIDASIENLIHIQTKIV